MSTIADSAAFPHWVEHDQLLMTAYNAYRASAVIALQYLGRLAASQQDAQKRVCELVATTKREQQNMLSDLYFTCYSQEGWGLYQWRTQTRDQQPNCASGLGKNYPVPSCLDRPVP